MFKVPTPLALTKWFFGLFGLRTEFRCNKNRLEHMHEHCRQCEDKEHHNCDPINKVQNQEVRKHIHDSEKLGGHFWNYYFEGEDFDQIRRNTTAQGPILGTEQDHRLMHDRMLTPESIHVSPNEGSLNNNENEPPTKNLNQHKH